MSFKKMLALLMSVLSIAACALPFSGCGKIIGNASDKGAKSGAVRNLTENISKNDSGSKAADKEFKAAAASFSATCSNITIQTEKQRSSRRCPC